MTRSIPLALCAAALLTLTACGEKPQGLGGAKQDSAPYTGTGKAYADPSWKAGDKASWESQLRTRAQTGQNDYSKVK
jgi:predicted small lipoprotein YifL